MAGNAQMLDGSGMSLQMLQDVFLLFANHRDTRVVKGLSDTLYTRRDQSGKIVDGMTKKGYEKMVRSMPGLLQGAFDMSVAGQCFANNLAFSAGQSWELKFEHFLSAVLDIATVRYPVQDGNLSESVKFLLDGHFIPLYADIFGEDFLQVDGTPVPLSLADRSKLPVIAEAARKLRTNLVSTAEGVMSPLRAAEAGLAVLDAKGITRHRSSRRASTFGTGGPRSGSLSSVGSGMGGGVPLGAGGAGPGFADSPHSRGSVTSDGASAGGTPSSMGGTGRSRRRASFTSGGAGSPSMPDHLRGSGRLQRGASAGEGPATSPLRQQPPPSPAHRSPGQPPAAPAPKEGAPSAGTRGGQGGVAPPSGSPPGPPPPLSPPSSTEQTERLVATVQQLMAVVQGLQAQHAQLTSALAAERESSAALREELKAASRRASQ